MKLLKTLLVTVMFLSMGGCFYHVHDHDGHGGGHHHRHHHDRGYYHR